MAALILPDSPAAAAGPVLGSGGFPDGFVWGAAASAPQTEGRAGRGRSNWDVFADTPGRIADGSDNRICNAFETRYAADLDLLAGAGLKAFRFSLAWPRIQPAGRGAPDAAGLDLYDRMVDAMLARHVAPWPTLFHWDIPASLRGEWLERDTAYRLADYAEIVGRRLGDRVERFIVLNEPQTVAVLGYAIGHHAPGLHSRAAYAAALHHQNLAQGLAFQALRSALPGGARVGTTLNLQPTRPATDRDADIEAAQAWDDAWNRGFVDPLYGHPYPARFADDLRPLLRPGDLEIIAAKPDFLGLNYYATCYVRAAPDTALGASFGQPPSGTRLTDIKWPILPEGLLEQLRELRDRYGNPEVHLTEFGAGYADPEPAIDPVPDRARIDWLRQHLDVARAALAEGCRLRGAFAWTLTDNWEWAEGYGPKFGLVRIDRETLARHPRESLDWLGRCAQANAVAG